MPYIPDPTTMVLAAAFFGLAVIVGSLTWLACEWAPR